MGVSKAQDVSGKRDVLERDVHKSCLFVGPQ